MYDVTTHLMLSAAEQHERAQHVAADSRARRLVRLRRLDRRAQSAVARARLARLAAG